MHLLELGRSGPETIFSDVHERVRFLARAARLGETRGLELLAWSLEADHARFLVRGPRTSLSQWVRLIQSGHGVDLYHRGRGYIEWTPPVPLPVVDPSEALEILYYRGARSPWTSVWDAMGLRMWPGAPTSLSALPVALHLAAAKVEHPEAPPSLHRVEWAGMRRALLAVTGRAAESRHNAVAINQLASRCGYRPSAVAQFRGVSSDAVRKSARSPLRPEVRAALSWLDDRQLAPLLETASTSREPRRPVW